MICPLSKPIVLAVVGLLVVTVALKVLRSLVSMAILVAAAAVVLGYLGIGPGVLLKAVGLVG
ncbi:hypothetical protein GAY28_01610 [Azospirillum brasilense]|nr:hypothetical protein [Azospirillum brasilense]